MLNKRDEFKLGAIYVDFVSAKPAYRHCFGGGEAMAKAVCLRRREFPDVLDPTDGLGAMLFASSIRLPGQNTRTERRSVRIAR